MHANHVIFIDPLYVYRTFLAGGLAVVFKQPVFTFKGVSAHENEINYISCY